MRQAQKPIRSSWSSWGDVRCIQAARASGSMLPPATPAFGADEREHIRNRLGIEHDGGLDPAAPREADAESHLAIERAGPVAVAVDDERDAGRRRRASAGAVEVEVARGAVDLQRGAGLRGCGVHRAEIERIALALAHHTVFGMAD